MDFFLTICTALGLGLGAALILGALLTTRRFLVGAVLGAAVAVAWLVSAGEAYWPAVAVGLLAGWACQEAGSFLDRVARREAGGEEAGRSPALLLLALGCGAIVAAASVFAPPISLVTLAALALVSVRRRRAESAKHAGLRILR